MRTDNLKCVISLRFPYKSPDGNGVVYTKAAVQKAVSNLIGQYPITIRDQSDDSVVLGMTVEPYSVKWDDDEGVCIVTTNGMLFHGGTECIVNSFTDSGAVNDFEVTGFGLSVE